MIHVSPQIPIHWSKEKAEAALKEGAEVTVAWLHHGTTPLEVPESLE